MIAFRVKAVLGTCAVLALTLWWLSLFLNGTMETFIPIIWAVGVFAVFVCLWGGWLIMQSRRSAVFFENMFDRAITPTLMSNKNGRVISINPAAVRSDVLQDRPVIDQVISGLVENPAATAFRLARLAEARGWAVEDVSREDAILRLKVNFNGAGFLWQLESFPPGPLAHDIGQTTVPMAQVNDKNRITKVNAAFIHIFGVAPKSPKTLSGGRDILPNQVQKLDTKDGERSFLVFQHFTETGVTELHFFPESAAKANAWATNLDVFDHLPVPLMQMSPTGKILQVNSACRSLLGQKIKIDADLADGFVAPDKSIAEILDNIVQNKLWSKSEFLRFKGAEEGAIFQASLSFLSLEEADFVVASFSDVTELKSLEAQFVQSQKMQAIGQLAGGVAHDFNNLLTAISGHCDLLLLRHDQTDPDYSDLMQIHQNANRAAGLVGQLLAFSRKQNLQLQSLDVRDAISDLAHLLGRLVGEKVNLILHHDDSVNPVQADKRQLEQVLMNLVVNARDAMPEGGDVEINTERLVFEKAMERQSAVMPPGEYVCVSVKDQGTGIPADLKRKIFEPFFTTKNAGEGTGLGLSTVYGIVKQSQGFIFVESEMGVGSTFQVLLPTSAVTRAVPADQSPKAPPQTLTHQKEGRVLLVEDEAPVRAFASRALQLRGFKVLEADCGEAALNLLEDDATEVDVFVTDVIMPGMDGPTWVQKALKNRPDTKVIFVSGYAEDDFSDKKNEIEGSVFLPKPFSLTDLTQAVQNILN